MNCDKIKEDILDADMVLIGIGSDFGNAINNDEHEKLYLAAYDLLAGTEYAWILPAYREYLSDDEDNKIREALDKFAEMLSGKNYFVISESASGALKNTGWKDGRIVFLRGCNLEVQCCEDCEKSVITGASDEQKKHLREAMDKLTGFLKEKENSLGAMEFYPDEVKRAMRQIAYQNEPSAQSFLSSFAPFGEEVCPECGSKLCLNNDLAGQFDKRKTAGDFERYTKWLGGTRNKKLVMLALGCGLSDEEMICAPFERIAGLQLKASLYKIDCEGKASETKNEKAVEISENIIDWLRNL